MADAKPEQKPMTKPEASPSPHYRFNDPQPRTFANVPITVSAGDVVEWLDGPPTEGGWVKTNDPVTRRPDNRSI